MGARVRGSLDYEPFLIGSSDGYCTCGYESKENQILKDEGE